MFIRNYLNSIKKFKLFYVGFAILYIGFVLYNHFSNPLDAIYKGLSGIALFFIIDISFSLKSLYKSNLKKQNIQKKKIKNNIVSKPNTKPILGKVS